MTDMFSKITDEQNLLEKIASKIHGFGGYLKEEQRRTADNQLGFKFRVFINQLHQNLIAGVMDAAGDDKTDSSFIIHKSVNYFCLSGRYIFL